MSFIEDAIARLVPGPFKEFLPFVSPSALKVIHKEKVLSLALEITGRAVTRNRYEEEHARIAESLGRSNLKNKIQVTKVSEKKLSIENLSSEQKKLIGETILELYFLMIHQPVALYLDLRAGAFSWDSATQILHWHPSHIFHLRTPEFLKRVQDLYKGFFEGTRDATERGLGLYRWDAKPSEGFDARIEVLMRKHFGDATSKAVHFKITHFKETFHLVFEEAIRSKSRFHPELTFLGAALAGLYVTLELLGEPLDVAKSYQNSLIANSSSTLESGSTS